MGPFAELLVLSVEPDVPTVKVVVGVNDLVVLEPVDEPVDELVDVVVVNKYLDPLSA